MIRNADLAQLKNSPREKPDHKRCPWRMAGTYGCRDVADYRLKFRFASPRRNLITSSWDLSVDVIDRGIFGTALGFEALLHIGEIPCNVINRRCVWVDDPPPTPAPPPLTLSKKAPCHPMKKLTAVLLAIISIELPAADPSTQDGYEKIGDQIEAHLEDLLANPDIDSLSAGVVANGELSSFHKGFQLNENQPNDDTLYEIASLTKTFTGTLLAMAIREARVHIDDDIRLHLPGGHANLAFDGEPITFRHLVTHQSGLPHMFPEIAGLFNDPNPDELPFTINRAQENFTKDDFFEALGNVRLDGKPGTTFNYSNAGANLLGYLLENVYDMPFKELLKIKILDPLGMTETGGAISDIDEGKLAMGQNENRIRMPARTEKAMNAEGGVISSTRDMLKYMAYHLETENPVATIAQSPLWEGKYGNFDAGCFWQIMINDDGIKRVFQNGGAFGTSSWLILIPDQGIGVFIVTNTAGANIHQKLGETADKIIESMGHAPPQQ